MKKTPKEFIKKLKTLAKTKKSYARKAKDPQDSSYWAVRTKDDKHRDWDYGEENWVKDYTASVKHPHRQVIIDLLHSFEWSYLLEVGCSTGPNLARIRKEFTDKALFGMDINNDSLAEAMKHLDPSIGVRHGAVDSVPFADDYFDVVLADAVLMYQTPKEINRAINELDRVTKKAILIVDRFAEKESITGNVWGRNYTKLLEDRGYVVLESKVTEEDWGTSKNWVKYGRYFLGIK